MSHVFMQDKNFLKEVDSAKFKTLKVRITALDWEERPIQDIQSSVVSGTLNLDGKSSIRRTCNLTIVTEQSDILNIDNIFSLNKKIKLELGYKNTFNRYNEFSDIWFNMGIFIITSASLSRGTSGVSISLQLKDKMCLLNGECGGIIPYAVTLDSYDTIDENGKMITIKVPMYRLIQELVNHFGKENLSKILISDVDNRIKKVMSWMGADTLYYDIENQILTQDRPTGEFKKYNTGADVGFIYEDFYYPGELSAKAGDSVTSILDKIKNTLGNYEYFYDVEGNFIFREVQNYLNTTKTKKEIDKINNNDYLIDISNGKSVYEFNDSNLIVSYSNNPQYNMIKNDFIVCGSRTTLSGAKVPIFYHLAIDTKPEIGQTYKVFKYVDPDDGLDKYLCPMDYKTTDNFPVKGEEGLFYRAGEEIYIWTFLKENSNYGYKKINSNPITIKSEDWRTTLYMQGSQSDALGRASNDYYEELKNEWVKLYNIEEGKFLADPVEHSDRIDYYLDFIDVDSSIAKFNIKNIGKRTKVIKDDSINCIFEPVIPDYVIIERGKDNTDYLIRECNNKGQDFILVDSSIYRNIYPGGRNNSAFEMVKTLLNEYTSYNESISLQCLPIYYLEPNTRITVNNPESHIHGDYIINSMSIPLSINGTMTISATKALEKF